MEVEIRCYGAVREVVGHDRLVRSVKQGATVADLIAQLLTEWPALSDRGDAGELVVMYDGKHVSRVDRSRLKLTDNDSFALSGRAMPE